MDMWKRVIGLLIVISLVAGAAIAGYKLASYRSPTYRAAPRMETLNQTISERIIFRTHPTSKLIALTFDDGPDPKWTPKVLKILNKYNAKATFFVIGSAVNAHPELVRAANAANMEIGVHEWEHLDVTTVSPQVYAKRVSRTIAAITGAGAPQPTLIRPPYGRIDAPVLQENAIAGLTTVLWSHHLPGHNPQTALQANLRTASPGMIVLCHDGRSDPTEQGMQALDNFIREMTKRGFQFVTVSELLAHETPQ